MTFIKFQSPIDFKDFKNRKQKFYDFTKVLHPIK